MANQPMYIMPIPQLLFFFFFSCAVLPADAQSTVTSIHWNSSNVLFTRNPASLLFTVYLQDKIDLICPHYKRGTLPELMEVSLLYMVDRAGYESCSVNRSARLVGLCTSPYKTETITVVFRRHTANPSGLEFVPGRRYYFITTSEGSMKQLQNQNGGLCLKKNMRLQFDVKESHSYEELQRAPKIGRPVRLHSAATVVVNRSESAQVDDFDRDELRRAESNAISDLSAKVRRLQSASDVSKASPSSRPVKSKSVHPKSADNLLFLCAVLLLFSSAAVAR